MFHLVVNAIVLWNTRCMEVALMEPRQAGESVLEEDVARLMPLLHEHVNMLGRCALTLPEEVAHGQLRRLRDPSTLEAYLERIEL